MHFTCPWKNAVSTISLFVAVVVSTISPAKAFIANENTDWPNGVSYPGAYLGVLDPGFNTVSGSLFGQCVDEGIEVVGVDCNYTFGPSAGDTQDSVTIEIGDNSSLDDLFVISSNVSAPEGFVVKVALSGPYAQNILRINYPLVLDGTTPNLIELYNLSLDPGMYALSVYGVTADIPGVFSLAYGIGLVASQTPEVPIPATALLIIGVIGLMSIPTGRKHKKLA